MNPSSISGDVAARQATADRLVADLAKMDRQIDASQARRKKRQPAPIPFATLRLRNIEKVMSDLYGSVLPEGDDGAMVDLEILIATVMVCGKPAINFMRKWAPWMPDDGMEKFIAGVDIDVAFLDADGLAKRMGVNFATKDRLKTRTIGSYDVSKSEREKIYRQRYRAKRKQAAADKKPALSDREKVVLKMVGVMARMSDVAKKAKRHPLFRGREDIPRQVRRIVDKLEKSGHCGSRLEPQHRGGTERFIWNEAIAKAKETAAAQAHPENVRRGTPIFIGSNRRTKSCVRTPKERSKTGLREGRDRDIDPVADGEHAPFARATGRCQTQVPELERMAS